MGLDVEIEIRGMRNARSLAEINNRISGVLSSYDRSTDFGNFFEFSEEGSVRFKTCWRYWGPGYERGPWFEIAGVLLVALSTGLDVRYGSDGEDWDDLPIMTYERLGEYWAHFLGPNGNDYRKGFSVAVAYIQKNGPFLNGEDQ